MAHVIPVKALVPKRERLHEVLAVARAEPAISLNMATYWAEPRRGEQPPVGCLLGHYVRRCKPRHLELAPINFLEQAKTLGLSGQLYAKYPVRDWIHHTLYYSGPDIEAWGLNAVCLYFQLREWHARRLFWPAPNTSALEVSTSLVIPMLERFISSEEAINP